MEKINDGGPAFPLQGQSFCDTQSGGGLYVTPYPGMTLRDYFAAKTVAAMICAVKVRFDLGEDYPDNNLRFARAAYAVADAMLAAREQNEQQA